jgi:ABC-2 type transport system permease protein
MFLTELKLSLRGMDMVIFALGFPVVIAVILGIIYGNRPAFEGAEYTFFEQSFGAVASVGICAAGVMGLPLVLSDYRHKKILKRFRVTPVSPGMLLFVQAVINFIYSVVSLLLVYIVSAVFFGFDAKGSLFGFIGSYLLVLASIYSIGMMISAISPDIKTANILCSVFYFPMIIFSGATLPYEVMPPAMQRAVDFMPLTQGIKLLKGASLGLPFDDIIIPVAAMAIISIICTAVSLKFFKWE